MLLLDFSCFLVVNFFQICDCLIDFLSEHLLTEFQLFPLQTSFVQKAFTRLQLRLQHVLDGQLASLNYFFKLSNLSFHLVILLSLGRINGFFLVQRKFQILLKNVARDVQPRLLCFVNYGLEDLVLVCAVDHAAYLLFPTASIRAQDRVIGADLLTGVRLELTQNILGKTLGDETCELLFFTLDEKCEFDSILSLHVGQHLVKLFSHRNEISFR